MLVLLCTQFTLIFSCVLCACPITSSKDPVFSESVGMCTYYFVLILMYNYLNHCNITHHGTNCIHLCKDQVISLLSGEELVRLVNLIYAGYKEIRLPGSSSNGGSLPEYPNIC